MSLRWIPRSQKIYAKFDSTICYVQAAEETHGDLGEGGETWPMNEKWYYYKTVVCSTLYYYCTKGPCWYIFVSLL